MHKQEQMTTAQVADRLGKSVATINRYVRSGVLDVAMELPGRTGARLFDPAEVERLAAEIEAVSS